MGRVYDITQRIIAGNQRPEITIDKDHVYKMNVTKAAAIKINSIIDKMDKEGADENKLKDDAITVALGKEALEYMDSLELNADVYDTVLNTIIAAIRGVTLKEMEEMTAAARKNFQEGKATGKGK